MATAVLIYPHDAVVYPNIDLEKVNVCQSPVGIAYVASYARSKGHRVVMVDVRHYGTRWETVLRDVLRREQPDMVGMYCLTPFFSTCAMISRICKEEVKQAKMAWGGPHPSVLPSETLAECEHVDYCVVGEGEIPFAQLLDGVDPSTLSGVAYRENGTIHAAKGKAATVRDLDALPWPAYDLLPYHRYSFVMGGTTLTMITGRGCPYTCTFCACDAVHMTGYRVRSVKDSVDEMEYYAKQMGIRQFIFEDDTYTVNVKRAAAISEEILRRRLNIEWFCNSRVTGIPLDLLKLMKRSGCKLIFFGIESGNQAILNSIEKKIRVEDVEQTMVNCRVAGIKSYGLFIIGHPYETHATAMQTIEFAKRLPLDYAQFAVLTPVPGAEVYNQAKRGEGIKSFAKHWDDYVFHGLPIIETPELKREQIDALRRKAYREFFLRPKYFAYKMLNYSIRDLLYDARAATGILGMMMPARAS